MLTYPWKCTVLHCNHWETPGNHWCWWPDTLIITLASVRAIIKVSGHQHQWFPGVFPGGYNVKLYISRGRLAWWLLAFLHSVHTSLVNGILGSDHLPILTLRGDKVSMLTHTYPHKPLRKIKVAIYTFTRLTAHLMCSLTSDLVICKFSKRMVIHDTECPYWDQVSLNNTNQPNPSHIDHFWLGSVSGQL